MKMTNSNIFDDIAHKVMEKLPPEVRQVKTGLEKSLCEALRSALTKLDVVTREEFDTQVALLKRCQAQLKTLEEQLAKVEK
jgi:BMFP domain-containing protein YqiC